MLISVFNITKQGFLMKYLINVTEVPTTPTPTTPTTPFTTIPTTTPYSTTPGTGKSIFIHMFFC